MPKVGTKSFPYTKEGEERAAAYAAATGQEVINDSSFGYARGGAIGTLAPESHDAYRNLSPEKRIQLGMAMQSALKDSPVEGHEGAEGFEDPKLEIDQMTKPYLQQYLQAGIPQKKAYWLSLIDIGNDPQTKYKISENPKLSEMFNGLFTVNNVNEGDIKEHRQTRSDLGLESPHLDASESERPEDVQTGVMAGRFGF